MPFTSPVQRGDPPGAGPEREVLTGWLDWHRATLLHKLEGLDEEQLDGTTAPPGLISRAAPGATRRRDQRG